MSAEIRFGIMVGVAICLGLWACYLLFRVVTLKGEAEGAYDEAEKAKAEKAGLDARCKAQSESIEAQRARIDHLLAAVGGSGATSAVGKPNP